MDLSSVSPNRQPQRVRIQTSASIDLARIESKNGVVVLSGYRMRVAVERGHLNVVDGVGRERREGRFHRATGKLRRLVVIGHAGTISFEALRWLGDVGCAFVQIGLDGEVIVASGAAGRDDPRLRRAQALAGSNGSGIALARDLLRQKLVGQATVLETLIDRSDAAASVQACAEGLASAETVDGLRQIEGDAAATYWGGWSGITLRWAKHDEARIPDHWKRFGTRTSPLTRSPRLAANPANALLNYAYAILEAEARIAALAVGLDPGLGVLHADQNARDSLALDLMEAVRPTVDAWVLDVLGHRTFRKADFFETREGNCRLMPPLAKSLAEQAPRWAAALAPVAEAVARAFVVSEKRPKRLPTPLTEANRRAGRPAGHRVRQSRQMTPLAATCQTCGVELAKTDRRHCNECLPDRRAELGTKWVAEKLEVLVQLRKEGRDPAHSEDADRKRAERMMAQQTAAKAWEQAEGAVDESLDFARDVLPRLQTVPLGRMVEATGLSAGYCSFVRRGLKIPHRRHWERLAHLDDKLPARDGF
jgi:CRISPR-associated endonuclease Cas1